jgi:CHAD domain-containing protein
LPRGVGLKPAHGWRIAIGGYTRRVERPDRRAAAVGLMAGAALAGAGVGAERARRSRRRRDRRRYRLRPGEPLTAELRRILDGRFEVAIAELEGRGGDRARAVHDARTAVKRLRSALRLVRDALGEQRYRDVNADLRAAAHALARARDAIALREALEDLAERYRELVDSDELSRLRERLAADDDAAAQGLDAAAADALVALRHARASLAGWPEERSPVPASVLARGLRRAHRRGRAAHRAALRDPSAENLHAWRRRVKDLRHQAELLREIDPKTMRKLRRRTRRLSDVLGDAHDLAALRAVASRAPIMAALVGRRRGELRDEAFAIGARLDAAPPRRVARRLRRRTRG